MFSFSHFSIRRRTLLALFLLALVLLPMVPIGVERAWAQGVTTGTPAAKEETCNNWLFPCITKLLGGMSYTVLQMMGWVLSAAGWVLDFVVQETVINMRGIVEPLLKEGGAIAVAWQAIRNLANAMFIFVILYIAISTILKANTHSMHQLLGRLIIAALLINFSLFFSKAIIDSSNVLAQGFYTRFVRPDGKTPVLLSSAIMNPLQLATIYQPRVGEDQAAFQASLGTTNFFTMTIMGSIFILITALVLFVIAVLLAVRFALLMLLMAFSPIGFVGMIVPALSGWGRQWWNTLLNQAFFAPVFFMMMYVVVSIINSEEYFRRVMGSPPEGADPRGMIRAFVSGGENMRIIFSFVLVIVMVLAALAVAKSMASKGSMGVTNWATKFAGGAAFGTLGWAGRKFVGSGARRIAESKFMQDAAANSRFGGMRLVQKSFKGVAGSSFDARGVAGKVPGVDLGKAGGKGGYEATFKRKVKEREDYAKTLGEGQVVDPEAVRAAENEAQAARAELAGMQRQASGPLSTQADRDAAHQAALRSYAADEALERAQRARPISRQEAYARRSGGLIDKMIGRRLGTGYASTAADRIERTARAARSRRELPVLRSQLHEAQSESQIARGRGDLARVEQLRTVIEGLEARINEAHSSEHSEIISRLEEQRGGGGAAATGGGGGTAGGGAAAGGGGTTT